MPNKLEIFNQTQLKPNIPDVRAGDTVKVYQKIKEGDPSSTSEQVKERIQVFEGVVLARKHGKGVNATITVRRVSKGVGVERIFPLHSLSIEKIEGGKKAKVRRAKLYYLREAKGRKARLKAKAMGLEIEEPAQSKGLAGETKQETAEATEEKKE